MASAPPIEVPTNGEVHLYPKLDDGGHNFRLDQIIKIKNDLNTELSHRIKLRRKCKTVYSSVHKVNMVSGSIGTLSAGGTLTTALSGLGLPASLPLGGVAIFCGITCLASSQIDKHLVKKLEKHNQILALILAKLSAINTLVSKALADNNINPDEYEYIQKQMDDFYQQKTQYQTKYRESQKNTDEKKLIEQGRQLGLKEAKQRLT